MADLEITKQGAITILTLNRPEARNALSMEMGAMLKDALHDIENDDSVRCVVLRGKGDHFMAGGDVKGMAESISKSPEEIKKEFVLRIHDLHPIMFAMRRMRKPIIASVAGAAAGAGVSVALCCDLIVSAESSFYTLAYCRIGTSPDGSSTYQLPRTLGIKRAMEMTLLGDRISAKQALDWGLVNFVVPDADLEAETMKLATRLANGPTFVYGQAKHLLYQSIEKEMETQLQAEGEAFAQCAARNDFREGVSAFVEKREAKFTGQ